MRSGRRPNLQGSRGYEIPEDLKYKQAHLVQIKAAREALEKREEALNPGKEIEDKKQISFADQDARIMGKKGNLDYQYNAQISVDEDQQIIVGHHLSQNANDRKKIASAVESMEEATGRLPNIMSADNGYMLGDNLGALEESCIDAYIATNKGEKTSKIPLSESDRKLVKTDFEYNEADATFACPGAQILELRREAKNGTKVYQGDSEVCAGFPYQSRCCQSSKGEARTIRTDDKEWLRQQMSAKMEEENSKEIYKKRKVIVEPVFGYTKKWIS